MLYRAQRTYYASMEGIFRDAQLPVKIIHLGASLMLLDGPDDLFFALAFLHCEIS